MRMIIDENISIGQAVKQGTAYLQEHHIENAAYDSFELLSDITGMSRTDYFMKSSDILPEEVRSKYESHLHRRAEHVPLQHITGKAYFYGREFRVNQDVLIPRPDTEVLVEQALQVLHDGSCVLDMCTGSGCIILTLALERSLKQAVGVDFSNRALRVAQENCDLLQALQVQLVQSDLFSAFHDEQPEYDLIVSNPPYIRSDVIPTLDDEVRLHDPMMALDGFADGLFFYRKITERASSFIKKGGWLMYEIGYDQAQEVSEMMRVSGFDQISVVKDLAGLDRVVRGRLI